MVDVGVVVVIRQSGEDGGRMPLSTELTLGRDEDCDIRIRLPEVSRLQAQLRLEADRVSRARSARVRAEAAARRLLSPGRRMESLLYSCACPCMRACVRWLTLG
jgi:hypothetical protein